MSMSRQSLKVKPLYSPIKISKFVCISRNGHGRGRHAKMRSRNNNSPKKSAVVSPEKNTGKTAAVYGRNRALGGQKHNDSGQQSEPAVGDANTTPTTVVGDVPKEPDVGGTPETSTSTNQQTATNSSKSLITNLDNSLSNLICATNRTSSTPESGVPSTVPMAQVVVQILKLPLPDGNASSSATPPPVPVPTNAETSSNAPVSSSVSSSGEQQQPQQQQQQPPPPQQQQQQPPPHQQQPQQQQQQPPPQQQQQHQQYGSPQMQFHQNHRQLMGYNYNGDGEPQCNGVWNNAGVGYSGSQYTESDNGVFGDMLTKNDPLMHDTSHPTPLDDPAALDGTHSSQGNHSLIFPLTNGSTSSPSNASPVIRSHYGSGSSDYSNHPSTNVSTPSSLSAMSSAGSQRSHNASGNGHSESFNSNSGASFNNIDENSLEPAQLALRLESM
jgi:hypothetical protein